MNIETQNPVDELEQSLKLDEYLQPDEITQQKIVAKAESTRASLSSRFLNTEEWKGIGKFNNRELKMYIDIESGDWYRQNENGQLENLSEGREDVKQRAAELLAFGARNSSYDGVRKEGVVAEDDYGADNKTFGGTQFISEIKDGKAYIDQDLFEKMLKQFTENNFDLDLLDDDDDLPSSETSSGPQNTTNLNSVFQPPERTPEAKATAFETFWKNLFKPEVDQNHTPEPVKDPFDIFEFKPAPTTSKPKTAVPTFKPVLKNFFSLVTKEAPAAEIYSSSNTEPAIKLDEVQVSNNETEVKTRTEDTTFNTFAAPKAATQPKQKSNLSTGIKLASNSKEAVKDPISKKEGRNSQKEKRDNLKQEKTKLEVTQNEEASLDSKALKDASTPPEATVILEKTKNDTAFNIETKETLVKESNVIDKEVQEKNVKEDDLTMTVPTAPITIAELKTETVLEQIVEVKAINDAVIDSQNIAKEDVSSGITISLTKAAALNNNSPQEAPAAITVNIEEASVAQEASVLDTGVIEQKVITDEGPIVTAAVTNKAQQLKETPRLITKVQDNIENNNVDVISSVNPKEEKKEAAPIATPKTQEPKAVEIREIIIDTTEIIEEDATSILTVEAKQPEQAKPELAELPLPHQTYERASKTNPKDNIDRSKGKTEVSTKVILKKEQKPTLNAIKQKQPSPRPVAKLQRESRILKEIASRRQETAKNTSSIIELSRAAQQNEKVVAKPKDIALEVNIKQPQQITVKPAIITKQKSSLGYPVITAEEKRPTLSSLIFLSERRNRQNALKFVAKKPVRQGIRVIRKSESIKKQTAAPPQGSQNQDNELELISSGSGIRLAA